jgi:hypothetical protein
MANIANFCQTVCIAIAVWEMWVVRSLFGDVEDVRSLVGDVGRCDSASADLSVRLLGVWRGAMAKRPA